MKVTTGPCPKHSDQQHRFNYDYAADHMVCSCGVTMRGDHRHPLDHLTPKMDVPKDLPPQQGFPRGTRMMFYQATPPDGWVIVGGPYYDYIDVMPTRGSATGAVPACILCEKQ